MSDLNPENIKVISESSLNMLKTIEKTIGWIPPIGKKMDFECGVEVYKKTIENDPTLTAVEKGAKISIARQEIKHYINQTKVVSYAIDSLEQNKTIREVEYEWLDEFFEKVKFISDEGIQHMWGKLLAYKFSGIEGLSKKLLYAFGLVDNKDILVFKKICAMSFENRDKIGTKYPFVYLVTRPNYYQKHDVRRTNIAELARTGLIEYNGFQEFVLPKKIPKLRYGDKRILLNSEMRINYGNIRLTNIGCALYDLTDFKRPDDFLGFCKNVWDYNGITYKIK